jgi:hypothetical protein
MSSIVLQNRPCPMMCLPTWLIVHLMAPFTVEEMSSKMLYWPFDKFNKYNSIVGEGSVWRRSDSNLIVRLGEGPLGIPNTATELIYPASRPPGFQLIIYLKYDLHQITRAFELFIKATYYVNGSQSHSIVDLMSWTGTKWSHVVAVRIDVTWLAKRPICVLELKCISRALAYSKKMLLRLCPVNMWARIVIRLDPAANYLKFTWQRQTYGIHNIPSVRKLSGLTTGKCSLFFGGIWLNTVPPGSLPMHGIATFAILTDERMKSYKEWSQGLYGLLSLLLLTCKVYTFLRYAARCAFCQMRS